MSDDRAGSRVAAVLEGLALQNASGELEIDGSPGGAIYLDRGEITFARSAWSPDLATRLHGALGPVAGLKDLLAAEDRPAGDLGGQLVRRGYLTAAELESIVRSVVLDAIIVLTVPLSADAAISGIRLVSGVSHWAGSFGRLNVGRDPGRGGAAGRPAVRSRSRPGRAAATARPGHRLGGADEQAVAARLHDGRRRDHSRPGLGQRAGAV